jgi:hypothetical protein
MNGGKTLTVGLIQNSKIQKRIRTFSSKKLQMIMNTITKILKEIKQILRKINSVI